MKVNELLEAFINSNHKVSNKLDEILLTSEKQIENLSIIKKRIEQLELGKLNENKNSRSD